MFGFPYNLIFIGLLVAALSFAGYEVWDGFTGSYVAKGAAAQLKADTVVVEKTKAERDAALARADHAEADAAEVKSASARQSSAIAATNKLVEEAQTAARKQAVLYAGEVAKRDARLRALQAAAAGAPTAGSCEKLLAATDAILRESGRLRQPAAAQ